MMKTLLLSLMLGAGVLTGAATVRAESPAEATYQSALAHYNAADYDAVLRECAEAVRADPNHWQAWSLLGNARYARGDKKGALEAYDRSLALNPDNPQLKTFADQLRPQVAAEAPAQTSAIAQPRSARPTEMLPEETSGHHGMSVGVGYMSIPVKNDFLQFNNTTFFTTQMTEDLGMSALVFVYNAEYEVREHLGITFSAGAGMPIGTATHDKAAEYANSKSTTSKNFTNEGDTDTFQATAFPILVGAAYHLPVGKNSVSVNVGFGACILDIIETRTNVTWTGATPNEKKLDTQTDVSNLLATPFMVMVKPGFRLELGNGVGLDAMLPLGFLLERKYFHTTVENQTSPLPLGMVGTEQDGFTIGGLTYGVQAAVSKTF